ncbi:ctr copper transporter family protein [Sclerotinia borealis F-4128]|uniref:Ctr copper transporter family protein n=1 Tax=Sclerotinia borealis (strain F-4128) TaxID=1432307 RepID=W9C7G4_SCLBF|nr:ctr copper transporter family protein [Sclerotinia borealis F-4128]
MLRGSWSKFTLTKVTSYLFVCILVLAPTQTYGAPTCTDFVISVPATTSQHKSDLSNTGSAALNVLVESTISNVSAELGIVLGTVGSALGLGAGAYSMSLRYCDPEVHIPSRQNTIQYLQHAITMTKNYWSGLDYPNGYNGEQYSYIAYMSKQGYSTLSVDNLGSGNSTHPDPVFVVQMTLQVEIIHNIIVMLRSGKIPHPYLAGRTFDKVIYVGHSYGSICGNAVATVHPKDVDTFVLTSYSIDFALGAVSLSLMIPAPAFLVSPRFSSLESQPFYLAAASRSGRQTALYRRLGGFDPAIVTFDFHHEGTVSLGEIATLLYGVGPAPAFTGNILVVTGKQDAICCYSPLGSDCGVGSGSIPARAVANFPNAANFATMIPDMTGHAPFLHYSAQGQLSYITSFLKGMGY